MKIAIVVPSLTNEAPVRIALSLAEGLAVKGHLVRIFYLKNIVNIPLPSHVPTTKLSFFTNENFADFDIVHTHMLKPDIFGAYKKLCSPSKFKLVSTLHNYVYDELENYYNKFVSVVFGTIWNISWIKFDKLFSLTKHSQDYYKKRSFNKDVSFVHNGHDINISYEGFDKNIVNKLIEIKKNNGYLIGAYCNLIQRKGIGLLIEHVASRKEASLVIFGNGPDKDRLIGLVESFQIRERVLFFDAIPNAHQYNYFFDLFAIPSKHEGFGLSLIEAALHKKSIICSDIDVFRELFTEDEVTFFNLYDSHSIDTAVSKALEFTNKGQQARNKARKKYSISNMVDSYEREYAEILKEKIE